MKRKIQSLLLNGILLMISVNSLASNDIQGFKVAIVEDAEGARNILKGKYHLGLKKLDESRKKTGSEVDYLISSCGARIMIRKLERALDECSNAIDAAEKLSGRRKKFFQSIAYSNRGITRYLLGDLQGASDDFQSAVSLDQNKIVISNHKSLSPNYAKDINYYELKSAE